MTTTTNPVLTLTVGDNHAKLLLSRDGATRTVTTIRPVETAHATLDVLNRLVGVRGDHLLAYADRNGGDVTGLRRAVLAGYADGLAARPCPQTIRSPRFDAVALAHQAGTLLAAADAPVRTAIRDMIGNLFADTADTMVPGTVADYTDDIAATIDLTELLAGAEPAEVSALVAAHTGSTPVDTSPLFDHLTGPALTAMERVVSRIDATGSPTYLTVNTAALRRWATLHRPGLLDVLDHGTKPTEDTVDPRTGR